MTPSYPRAFPTPITRPSVPVMPALTLPIVLAAEGGEEASGVELLVPELPELIWGLVAFLVLFGFMSKWVFPKANTMLDERRARIQGQLEQAEATRQEAEQLRAQYAEQLADARGEADRIRDEARQDADRIRSERVAAAESEAESIRTAAREEAQAERGRVVADLRSQVAAISVDLAGKIVQRELDADRHRDLVDRYINELSSLN